MKQKLSITIDEDKVKAIEQMLKDGVFRNKSHILEYCLNEFLKQNAEKLNQELKMTDKNKLMEEQK